MASSEDLLALQPGDYIIWQDEKIKPDEDRFYLRGPGMVGKVVSIHNEIPPEDPLAEIVGKAIPPGTMVEFENGMRILVDRRMKWEKVQRH